MKLVVAKVDEIYFDGEAESLTVPGSEGELTVMGGHMPLITTLKAGKVTLRAKDIPQGVKEFSIEGGVLEVHPGGATVIL